MTISPWSDEAYLYYHRARHLWHERRRRSLIAADHLLELALEKDPDFLEAYAARADVHNILGVWRWRSPQRAYGEADKYLNLVLERYSKGLATERQDFRARKALSLVYVAKGFQWQTRDWDWGGAMGWYRRAMKMNPSYAPAHQWVASAFYAKLRFFDSAKFHLDRAKELSGESIPLIVLSVESWVSYLKGEYHEALATCEDILDKDPKFFPAMYRKALILAAQSQSLDPPEKNELLAKAVGVLEKAEDGDRNSAVQGARAYILGLSGESVRAARIVRELIEIRVEREKAEVPETRLRELGYVSYFDIAIAWMGLNEHAKAMDALESAFEYADGGIDWLQVLPVFEPLRSKPRFKRLMRQLRYPMVNAGGSKPNTG